MLLSQSTVGFCTYRHLNTVAEVYRYIRFLCVQKAYSMEIEDIFLRMCQFITTCFFLMSYKSYVIYLLCPLHSNICT